MSESLQLEDWALALWQALADGSPRDVTELAQQQQVDQSKILVAATTAAEKGWMVITEQSVEEVAPSGDAVNLIEAGLPERRALAILAAADGEMKMGDFVQQAKQADIAVNEVFKWGAARGWVERDGKTKTVRLLDAGRQAASATTRDVDEEALLAAGGKPFVLEATDEATLTRMRELLAKRPELAKLKKRTRRAIALTEAGQAQLAAGVSVRKERNLLTSDDLRSGEWRNITLRPYDVTLPAETIRPAKVHPLRKIIDQTRRAYLEMGFTEVVSPMVESSFWNFDALFQPQDHPARDMQDTFYMEQPKTTELPDDADLVDRVRRAHEDGGDTGSEGWGYKWSADRARQIVLRTHTTASTIRALTQHPEPPFKAFCIGWVCRNETMSYKHLPVFHQVDGIVIDEKASLATLLGTLETFYKKMGFQQVKFKPAFYPYTEPSVDVVVYLASRGKWIEMGGSGIFRPEVTEPLGCKYPVMAWGLGMERLAMIRYGLSDIRELYQGRIESLRSLPLAQ